MNWYAIPERPPFGWGLDSLHFPELPFPPALSRGDWEDLERAAGCEFGDGARDEIERMIAAYRRCENRETADRELRSTLMKRSRELRRKARGLLFVDPHLAAAIADEVRASKVSASRFRRSVGRPNAPHLDRLLLSLSGIYAAAAIAPTSPYWMAFLRCAALKAGVRIHSDEAFTKRVHTICRGAGPAARHRRMLVQYKSLHEAKRHSPLGVLILELLPYITFSSGAMTDTISAFRFSLHRRR